jgi:hypothetical protein
MSYLFNSRAPMMCWCSCTPAGSSPTLAIFPRTGRRGSPIGCFHPFPRYSAWTQQVAGENLTPRTGGGKAGLDPSFPHALGQAHAERTTMTYPMSGKRYYAKFPTMSFYLHFVSDKALEFIVENSPDLPKGSAHYS